jgi:CRP-like cAMP-binding protein
MNFEDISIYLKKQGLDKEIEKFFDRRELPSKYILLNEGEIAEKAFFVKTGCLRSFFYKDGKDITSQFFFENDVVASAESFFEDKPSKDNIETIEKTIILEFPKKYYGEIIEKIPVLKNMMYIGMQRRLFQYMNYMRSYIQDKPVERYLNLMKTRPEIIQRVPQHYIASYLGMTSVSLSRIRNKIKSER